MENYKLNNGLKVYLNPIKESKIISCGIWVNQGSKYEDYSTSGLSHFVEHMMFRTRTKGILKNIDEILNEVIKKGANSVKEFYKEKLGEENYNAIIDAKGELVYYTKNAFDIVGNVTSNLWEQGKSKVKSWYEKFRNN